MAEHSLKTWPSFWRAIERGEKRFEVRRHDRDFAVGDVLLLRLWDPSSSWNQGYVCREDAGRGATFEEAAFTIRARVTYLMPGGRFGVDPGWCVLGIEVEQEPEYVGDPVP